MAFGVSDLCGPSPALCRLKFPDFLDPSGLAQQGSRREKRRGRTFDATSEQLARGGVFAVDKPEGPTSADVVALVLEAVMSRLGGAATKVGHGGTLDPFASGVLVIGIGLGTRMLKNFLHGSKTYQATVRMGIETDTQDSAGTAVRRDPFDFVTREALEEMIPSYRGSIMQWAKPLLARSSIQASAMSAKTEVDVDALRKLIPLGAEPASTECRERLFKEFVVRSAHLIGMGAATASKGKSRAWGGTLSQESILTLLQKALEQAKVFRECDNSDIESVVQQAFRAARRSLEPVCGPDNDFIDMNQWHILVFYLVTGLSLLANGRWRNGPQGWAMAMEDFGSLCQRLVSSRWSADMVPEVVEQLKEWAKSPNAASWDLEAPEGVVDFATVAEWLVNSQLPTWHGIEEEIQGRKRAFQLLQLMNNTPSLPNSVPGKLTPRNCFDHEQALLPAMSSMWHAVPAANIAGNGQ
eukprot:s30_g3.t1